MNHKCHVLHEFVTHKIIFSTV